MVLLLFYILLTYISNENHTVGVGGHWMRVYHWNGACERYGVDYGSGDVGRGVDDVAGVCWVTGDCGRDHRRRHRHGRRVHEAVRCGRARHQNRW